MTNAELDAQVIEFDRKRSFTLFRDLSAQSTKQWLVSGFLGAGEASALYGKPGDGKSVLAEDMALHIAAGRDWHGRKVKGGAVVYVALERRLLVERRAIAFREHHDVHDLPFAIVGGVYDFRDQKTAVRISDLVTEVAIATEQPVVLVAIDTLSRALFGGDENAPKDMGAIVAATGLLQERTGAHVQWVHHMPQDGGERMRGHGALLGAVDTTIYVAKAGDVRTATVIKANDSEEGATLAFTLESVIIGCDMVGVETTCPVVVPAQGINVQQRSVPRSARTALDLLRRAIVDAGEKHPASNHVPDNAIVVPQPMAAVLLRGHRDRQRRPGS